jgi:glycosyltransferase involved in cell wall biosynthesis
MVVSGLMEEGYEVHAVFGSDGPMAKQYRDLGCSVQFLPHGQWLRGGSGLRSLRRWIVEAAAVRRFRALLKHIGPDLVYVNNLTGIAAVAAARLVGIPSIWHIRELFEDVGGEMHIPAGGKALTQTLVRHLPTRIIAISQGVAQNVIGAPLPSQVCVIPNAVSDTFFEEDRSPAACRTMLRLPTGAPIVGVPGTLRPVKGHDFFLGAAPRVRQVIPDCHYAITGTGSADMLRRLTKQVQDAGLEDRVHFLATVGDMSAFYRACDVICVPSRSESFGRTVIEAFAVGSPVVATSVDGIRETVENERTGLLVPYGDAPALAASLVRVLTDRGLAARLAAAGRQKAEKCYHERMYRERIRNVVREVISRD